MSPILYFFKFAAFACVLAIAVAPANSRASIPCESSISFKITYDLEKARQDCGENCGQVRKDTASKLGCSVDGAQIYIPPTPGGAQEAAFSGANDADIIGSNATSEAQNILSRAKAESDRINRGIVADVNNVARRLGLPPIFGPQTQGASSPNGGATATMDAGQPSAGGGFSGGPSSSGISGFPPMPTKEQIPNAIALAKAQADWRLAQRARQTNSEGKIFPRAEAEKANDPEMRKQLINLSNAQQARAELKTEGTRLTNQLAELAGLAIEAKRRATGINSLPESAGKHETPVVGKTSDSDKKLAEDQPDEKSDAVSIKAAETNFPAIAKGKDLTTNAASPSLDPSAEEKITPEERAHFRQARLRDLLRAKLTAEGKDASKILSETFEGKLARESTENSTANADPEAGNIFSGAFTAAKNAAFAMSTAETEAEVKRLLRESQRELASLAAGGILDIESSPLFARVSLAHRRCQEHRCVR